jgi:type VI protein secretion system component VasF
MYESPRPDQVGDERTPLATEPEQSRSPADPRSESGAAGVAARYPLWLIVGGFIIFALVLLYIVWEIAPNLS